MPTDPILPRSMSRARLGDEHPTPTRSRCEVCSEPATKVLVLTPEDGDSSERTARKLCDRCAPADALPMILR